LTRQPAQSDDCGVLSAAQLRIIGQFWADFLGCNEQQLSQPGFHVVPHGNLAGYTGLWAFRVNNSCVISVPEALLAAVREAAAGMECEQACCAAGLKTLVGADRIARVIGPCFVGYLGGQIFHPAQGSGVCRLLTGNDLEQIEGLKLACGNDWEIGGVDADAGQVLFGCFEAGRLVAAASYELWGQAIAHVCVAAAPEFRRQGFAQLAAARATELALSRGLLPQWRTEYSNAPAMAIGRALGFEGFASHYAVRLR